MAPAEADRRRSQDRGDVIITNLSVDQLHWRTKLASRIDTTLGTKLFRYTT